jgi:GNAT superfamily N-acetyltransferase
MMLPAGMHDVPAGHVAAVVTYLQMTTPAIAGTRPLPDGMTISHEKIGNDSYRALFRAIGAPWLWTSRLTLDDASLGAILQDPTCETWIVRHDGAAIALIELDFSAPATCELAFFGMIASATGQGLGGPMMAHAQARAFHDNADLFTVHTCSLDDPRALTFYQKAGFTPIKRAIEVFADPRINGPHAPTTAPQIPCLT